MEDYYNHQKSSSMMNKIKNTILCNSCCNEQQEGDHEYDSTSKVPEPSSNNGKKAVTSSLRKWIRSELSEIVAGMSAGGGRKHRVNSAEFRYDPLSYALNFEDGDEFPLRSFSDRLPPSPTKNVATSREIAAWS